MGGGLIKPATSTTSTSALMSIKMLKNNCHWVFGSQKSILTLLEQLFQTDGAINSPPPSVIGLKQANNT